MKRVLFVGGYDKLDLLIYIGSIITGIGKKALVVDMSNVDRAKYIIPSVYNVEIPNRYITKYMGVDVAVGYHKYSDLEKDNVFSLKHEEQLDDTTKKGEYDVVIYNIDSDEAISNIPIEEQDLIFVTTSFDIYSLEKAVRAFKGFDKRNNIYRVLFTKKLTNEQVKYFSFIFKDTNLNWQGYPILFLLENGDQSLIYENQRLEKINLKSFSSQFKSSLKIICEMIEDNNMIGRYIKELERK